MRNQDGSAYVGFNVVIEDVNLVAGDFRHKRQNLGQAIQQSNLIDLFLKQQNNINNNLYFTRSHFEKSFKDNRETKTRLIRVMLNFKSFQCQDRKLGNEFKQCTGKSYNSEILKRNWYPAAHYLMRKYILQNNTVPLYNLTSAQPSPTVLTEVGMKLLEKVKKSKSNAIDVKAVIKSDSRKNKTEVAIKRKAKQIMNQLLWKESPFEDAAAICNYDGSKTAANKSKFRQSLLTNFTNLHVSQEKKVKSLFPTGTERLSDFHIHSCTEFLKSTRKLNISVMYPMLVATLYTIFSSKTKTLEEVIHREKHCVIPININAHWAVLYLDGNRNQAYYLGSYGNKPNDQLVRNVQQKFANWTVLCNLVKLQNDSYQCGVWSCYFISFIFEFLKNSLKPSIPFEQFIKISLNVNHLCDVRINRNNIN